jgi:polyether ionophore transport system permease protein
VVFGVLIASSATSYVAAFPDAASRAELVSTLQGNRGFEALFGTIHGIDTVAGYTAYKTLYSMVILGAIWGLLISTRLLRGEEDAGRWELFLAGRTTRGQAAAQAAIGLGIGVVALWLPTAVIAAAAGGSARVGISVGASFYLAAAAVAAAAMFMAVGMFLSQLTANRHEANLIGAAVLAGAYLVRMVADSAPELGWLRWASPFGWIEQLRPLTGSDPLAFLPIVAWVLVLSVATVEVAARRDVGAGAGGGGGGGGGGRGLPLGAGRGRPRGTTPPPLPHAPARG